MSSAIVHPIKGKDFSLSVIQDKHGFNICLKQDNKIIKNHNYFENDNGFAEALSQEKLNEVFKTLES